MIEAARGGVGLRGRESFDWPLFLAVAAIAILGVVNLYSATSYYVARKEPLADVYVSQVYWLMLGVLLGALIWAVDYRHYERLAYVFYAGGVGSLLLLFVLGKSIRGSTRWIEFGRFTFQPSEFVKLLVILGVAKYLHDDPKTEPRTLFDLAPPALLTAVPVVLVMIQPDFGTSMIYALTVATMLGMTKIRRGTIAWLAVLTPATAFIIYKFVLRDYQLARIRSFLSPEEYKTDIAYHALQSQTAIGNGGLWGEGYMLGTQNQFGFLPDQYSDFPFAVYAEDWGLAGAVVLLSLYAFVCVWAIQIASQAKDRFGAAVAVGVGASFYWHTFFNVGMAIGLLPVVGITLPLFSYGGSSIVTTLAGFGLLMNVSSRR